MARELFLKLGLQRARLRLVGVRAESLVTSAKVARQQMLGEREMGWREADRAVDRASARFGSGSVRPGVVARSTGTGGAVAPEGTAAAGRNDSERVLAEASDLRRRLKARLEET